MLATSEKPCRAARLAVTLTAVFLLLGVAASAARAADPVIAAAGDIACDPNDPYYYGGVGDSTHCRQRYTSNLLVNAGLAVVLPLGDIQYDNASASALQSSYNPTWGRVKSISRPALGNHEPGSATGYFDYFNGKGQRNGAAGERGKGYYSFNVGTWHLIALNSNCARVACTAGSAQERWLRADLASNAGATCTLAYWHHPRFSSGHDGNNAFMQPIWKALLDGGVDVALSGHSHNYERFAPMNANGKLDRARGTRQFVVGTGGAFFTGIGGAAPNSEVRQNNTFGVLTLTLRPTSYTWKFVPESGKKFTDTGTTACSTPPSSAPLPVPGPVGPPLPASVNRATGAPNGANAVTCTITGTAEHDVLRGTAGNDRICGLGGRDTIRGGGGNDLIFGGTGNDRILGGAGSDRLYGNAGRDLIRGQGGSDRLSGGPGRDRLFGNAGRDVLSGRDGRCGDRISGGGGRDRATADPGDTVRLIERLRRRH
jgi:acid phosphatase type 7